MVTFVELVLKFETISKSDYVPGNMIRRLTYPKESLSPFVVLELDELLVSVVF